MKRGVVSLLAQTGAICPVSVTTDFYINMHLGDLDIVGLSEQYSSVSMFIEFILECVGNMFLIGHL